LNTGMVTRGDFVIGRSGCVLEADGR